MNKKDLYIYPAIFYYEDKNKIAVIFPDFPGCATCGKNDLDALQSAKEALGLHILGMEEDGDIIPEPTPLYNIAADEDCPSRTVLVEVYMTGRRAVYENKAVNKMVTLPKFMVDLAKSQGINVSLELKKALEKKIKCSHKRLQTSNK